MSKDVPDKQGNKEKPSNSVLRNLLVSGHDSNKGHYVLPKPRRDWSPSSSSSRKGSSLDTENQRDASPQPSPLTESRSPLTLRHTKSTTSSADSAATVSSSAQDCGEVKKEETPAVVTAAPQTLLLHPSSLGRLKLLRFASPSANRSIYATRASNGRLQLYTQPHAAAKVFSVVFVSLHVAPAANVSHPPSILLDDFPPIF